MINLLPKGLKSNIVYAKRNTILMRWIIVVILSIIGLYAILGIGYFYLQTTAADLNKQLENNVGEFSEKEAAQIEADVKSLEAGVDLASDVISRQLLFSKLLASIGHTIPDGARLGSLVINDTDQAIDLKFSLKDEVVGAQLGANLSDPNNGIFSKVDIVSVECDAANLSEYPCTANLRALFADNSAFRFDTTSLEEKDE